MKRYAKYARPYLGAFIIGPCMMIAEVMGDIMLPRLMALIINQGVARHDTGYILKIGLCMVLVACGMASLLLLQGVYLFYQRFKAGPVREGPGVLFQKY